MTVVITGANSAAGLAILRRAARESPPLGVVAAVRSEGAARALGPLSGAPSRIARISYDEPASLEAAFRGAAAVIHLAGILVERPGSTYEQANVSTARAVVAAAGRSGVRRLVLASAVGADPAATNRYWRSKGEAEGAVRASGLGYAILRLPLLLGRGTEGAAALRRHLGRPVAVMPGGGRTLQQPLDVEDLARAALAATEPALGGGCVLDLVGPVSLPQRELLARAARVAARRVRVWPAPTGLVRLALALRQRLAGPGFSPDALEVITTDTRLDPAPAAAALGLGLTSLDEMIRHSLEPEPPA
ncbi:MAG TPA: NAD(P)H-binding protein [Verrucomicrobiae bacterium]|nr:NAD(P)H-binding protein [Verrucomicrobiae bacterium]